ncbi:MAG TPA: hypothetical protein PKN64_10145 [Casimicrobium sp.]|jgi:dihydrofolate reductase|nr:hypothetical protein [Casimicrobium sp.]
MKSDFQTTFELNQDEQDALRSLLDSEIVLIGGGEVVGTTY